MSSKFSVETGFYTYFFVLREFVGPDSPKFDGGCNKNYFNWLIRFGDIDQLRSTSSGK